MNIGIYNPYLDSLSGGERYMLTIAYSLQNDHNVDIFWDDKSIIEKTQKKLSINLDKVKVVPNIFNRGIPLLKAMFYTRHYHLIVALSDGSIPFIFSQKGILHFQRPFQNVGGRSIANKIKLGEYNKIICNSKFTKQYIDKEYGVSSDIVYPPVSVDQFKSIEKEKIIVSVGRFHEFKKHEVMIESFKNLSQNMTDWRLVIIGGLAKSDRAYFKRLKSLIGKASIKLLHDISFGDLKEYLSKSSIYWHAAGYGEDEKKHPENFEHFGIAPVEAMASGCIPVVFNGGGLSEIITHGTNGYLFNTKKELVEITNNIIATSDTSEKIRRNAIQKSNQFSQVHFRDQIISIVKSLT